MRPIEHAVGATSEARELCLSLRRAFIGPRARHQLRSGAAPALTRDELRVALGLAWAAGEIELIRGALRQLDPERVDADPVLVALRDVTR
jgi:hypothetical protein